MKLEDEESDNVEDRRGEGGGGFPFGGRGIGIGSIAIALVASYFLGINPMTVLNILSGGGQSVAPTQQSDQTQSAARAPMASDPMKHLVALVLRDTEKTWTELFKQDGATYIKPRLVVFTGGTQTACGPGLTASGPFYCPGDQKVYIDLDFYQLMKQKFHVAGDFAQAYVIAHEVGHYVQNLLGIMDKVDKARQRSSEVQSNALSVRLELQADCFAGVWAFHANEARSIRSRMAARRSGLAGSNVAWTAARSATAIRSTRASCSSAIRQLSENIAPLTVGAFFCPGWTGSGFER